jgi:hypothetical protein
MSRARTLEATMKDVPCHGGVLKDCVVMTETAIHTIELPEGHFAAIVFSRGAASPIGAISILDEDEVEAHILLLRNAMEDAKRLDAGQETIHAAPTLRRS